MIISTVITLICFIIVVFEIFSIMTMFKSCVRVHCEVITSQKIQERKDGFLVNEYWKTKLSFDYDGKEKEATVQTSTFCQKGQILNCFYYPKKDIIFRRRDFKKVVKSSSMIITSTGILFLFLNIIFKLTTISSIIKNNLALISFFLFAVFFAVTGLKNIVYYIRATQNTLPSKVAEVEAEVIDVIRKSKKHKENVNFTYYPIYKYTFNGEEHETKSKRKYSNPLHKGDKLTIMIDRKKAGPVEYNDVTNSYSMGVCFLVFAIVYIMLFCFGVSA